MSDLTDRPQAAVMVLESEQARLAAQHYFPQYVCLNTKDLSDCRILQGRIVHLWPDGGSDELMRHFAVKARPYVQGLTLHSQQDQARGWGLPQALSSGWTREQVLAHAKRDGGKHCDRRVGERRQTPRKTLVAASWTEKGDSWKPIVVQYLTHQPHYGPDGSLTWSEREEPIATPQTSRILLEALNKPEALQNRWDQMRIAKILQRLGYRRRRKKKEGRRFWVYQSDTQAPVMTMQPQT